MLLSIIEQQYFRLYGILVVLALSACATIVATTSTASPPELPPATTPTRSPGQQVDKTSKVWQIVPTDDLQHYSASISTQIQEISIPQAKRDSTVLKAQYTFGLTRSVDSTLIHGSIEQFSTQAGSTIGSETSSPVFPMAFTGFSANHEIHLNEPSDSSPCTTLQTALSVIPRSVFLAPLQVAVGTTWQDSTSFTVCSGSLTVKILDIKSYTLIGETEINGNSALSIEQKERAFSTGEGSQDQHRISMSGETQGTAHLTIDRVTGVLLELIANRSGKLSIQVSGRARQFLQTSTEIIRRVN